MGKGHQGVRRSARLIVLISDLNALVLEAPLRILFSTGILVSEGIDRQPLNTLRNATPNPDLIHFGR
jgi:hypothetical protein